MAAGLAVALMALAFVLSLGHSNPVALYVFTAHAGAILTVIAGAGAALAVMQGATFIGGEWAAGTMTLLLAWEPRRLPVMAAKLASVVRPARLPVLPGACGVGRCLGGPLSCRDAA
ncbi:MAG: hypothetical protein ACRDJU_09310 [Actinomycetota bacterium]